jgi:protein ImuB
MAGSDAVKTQAESVPEILAILHKWGIHTLGQLAALDKEELRTRLGSEAVALWERANGTATRLLKLVQPPESFDENFEFDHEIETAQPLLFILRRFLEQLTLRLSAIYLVAQELTLRISFADSRQVRYQTDSSGWRNESAAVATATRTDKQIYERVFKIPQPTNDVELLFRMLHTHLENFKSPQPIIAVGLSAKPIRPVSQQFGLFETALRNPQQLFETLARLTALLGNERVGTPVLEETHRPDAFRMEAFSWNFDSAEFPHRRASARAPLPQGEARTSDAGRDGSSLSHWERQLPVRLGPRSANEGKGVGLGEGRVRASGFKSSQLALRRFRPSTAASILTSGNRHLHSDKVSGKIVDQRGPYLLSGNWWDEKWWARAEWDMQLDNGDLVRAYEIEGIWKIEGVYD